MLRGRRDHDREGTEPIPGVFYLDFELVRDCFEEVDVPENMLQGWQANRQPNYRDIRNDMNASQKARGFFLRYQGQGPEGIVAVSFFLRRDFTFLVHGASD